MIIIRDRHTRGHTDMGWLDSRHSFSFGNYRDLENMGFGALRAVNDDHVAPGAGFAAHRHSDMEIISYVFEGALEHKDDLGNGSVIMPGDVQRMSAGTGVTHGEYNASQKCFPRADLEGRLRPIADRWDRENAVTVRQDVAIFSGELSEGERFTHEFAEGWRGWLHVARGLVHLNGDELREGDSAQIDGERAIEFDTDYRAEILLFDIK